MEKIKEFLRLFSCAPMWLRAIVVTLLSVLFALYLFCSCGQAVKVTVRDTPSGVSISTTQTKQDSSGTHININPNISFPK